MADAEGTIPSADPSYAASSRVLVSAWLDVALGVVAGPLFNSILTAAFIGSTPILYVFFRQPTTYPIWYGTGGLALVIAIAVYVRWLRRFRYFGTAYLFSTCLASAPIFWLLAAWPSE